MSDPQKVFCAHLVFLVFVLGHILSRTDAEFSRRPENTTVAQGQLAVFSCQHTAADTLNWRVNETLLTSNRQLEGITFNTQRIEGGSLKNLRVIATPEYNSTSIVCVAFTVGQENEEAMAVLLIQGALSSPQNLARESVTKITWTEPFSLSLTYINPNVIYCVHVSDITCAKDKTLLIRDCNVTSSYYYSELLQDRHIYNITVTPRSNGDGSLNGTPAVLIETFASYGKGIIVGMNSSYLELSFQLTNVGNVQPTEYLLSLVPVDGVGDNTLIRQSTVVEPTTSTLRLSIAPLQKNRVWEIALRPYECSLPISEKSILSTHQLQNINVSSPGPDKMKLTGNWIGGEASNRVLVIAYNTSPNSTYYFVVDPEQRSSLDREISLPGDEYNVSVFPFGENGRPFKRAATVPLPLTIANTGQSGNEQQPFFIYSVDRHQNGTEVTCTFQDDTDPATTCMVVIHKRITILDSYGLNRIKESRILKRRGDTASGLIQVEIDLEEYELGVFKVVRNPREPDGSTQSQSINVAFVIVITLLVTAMIAAIVIVLIIIIIIWIKKRSQHLKSTSTPYLTRNKTIPNKYEEMDKINTPESVNHSDSDLEEVIVDGEKKEKQASLNNTYDDEEEKLLASDKSLTEDPSQSMCTNQEPPDNHQREGEAESSEMVEEVDKCDDTSRVTQNDNVLVDKLPKELGTSQTPPFKPEAITEETQRESQPQPSDSSIENYPVDSGGVSERDSRDIIVSENALDSKSNERSSVEGDKKDSGDGNKSQSLAVEESSLQHGGGRAIVGAIGYANVMLEPDRKRRWSLTRPYLTKDVPGIGGVNIDVKQRRSDENIHVDDMEEILENQSQFENNITASKGASDSTSGEYVQEAESKATYTVRIQPRIQAGRNVMNNEDTTTELSSSHDQSQCHTDESLLPSNHTVVPFQSICQ